MFGAFRRMFCGICADVCRRDIFSGGRQEGKGGALYLGRHRAELTSELEHFAFEKGKMRGGGTAPSDRK